MEQPLNNAFVLLIKRFVVIANAMLESVDETLISYMIKMRLQIGQLNIQESVAVVVRRAMCKDVINSESTLTAGRHKNDDGLGGRVLDNSQNTLASTW